MNTIKIIESAPPSIGASGDPVKKYIYMIVTHSNTHTCVYNHTHINTNTHTDKHVFTHTGTHIMCIFICVAKYSYM